MFSDTKRERQPIGGRTKRAFDLALATATLVLAAPIMLVIAALIRGFMAGPVIYGQQRIGFNSKVFVCYKFRTGAVGADVILERHLVTNSDAAREWRETRKLLNDPRVDCLGRVLLNSSLDELPQLFNVLRGDMSLIGPRPVAPHELSCYGPDAQLYLKARPGLTGMWRTSGRNRLSYAARLDCDRDYVLHWSLWRDLALLIKTIPNVLKFDETA